MRRLKENIAKQKNKQKKTIFLVNMKKKMYVRKII